MKRLRAYKTKLVLNNKEASYFLGCAGFSRFVFNWGLAEWKRQYEAGEKPSAYSLKKQFNAIKDKEFPWVREYPYVIEQEAFDHLGRAFQNFFRRVKKGEKPGYPKFKKRGISDRFTLRDCNADRNDIKLPIIGWTRLAESHYLPTENVKILSANISKRGKNWLVSLQVEKEVQEPVAQIGKPLGIDLGIKSQAVCSNGKVFDNPKTLSNHERKLKRLSRELSRRKLGGCNREKTKVKLSREHQKIADIRSHGLHNISRYVTAKTKPRTIVIEDLNVSGMMKNHRLAKSLADSSMSELRRQIEYKAEWNGIQVLVADRFYPSSKKCSKCGNVKGELSLSDRIYICDSCGNVIDRDMNAALNLAALARTVEATGIACGVTAHLGRTVKQEGGRTAISPPAAGVGTPAPSYI